MKITKQFSILSPLLPALIASTALMTCSAQADTLLMLNFSLGNAATNTPTYPRTITGYDNVCAPFVGTAVNATDGSVNGTTSTFTINNVSSYDTQVNSEPLTTSGFYNLGNTSDHTFTLTGLQTGFLVTLYAVAAWDGNGRGGVITFGTGTTQAQTLGDPGTAPTLANFTQINAIPLLVDNTGTVTGTLNGAGGVNTATEGQVGGFIFDVASPAITGVPEPSTVALLVLGVIGGGFIVGRRVRTSAA